MSFTIEARPEDFAVVVIMREDFNPQHELETYAEQLKQTLDALPHPCALITNVDPVAASFGDIVTGLGMLTQGKLAVLGHPNISELVVVTTKDLYSLSAKALGQAQYGSRRVTVAKTIEEAIKNVREQHVTG